MADNITFDIDKLITGITKAAAVIKPTYGASGGNILVQESLYPYHAVRNDGKAIMDKVILEDPIENMGVNIMREVGDKIDKDSGDGRKTTMILTEAILLEGQKVDASPMDIKRSLDECLPIIIKAIDDQKKEITVDEIKSVATISSESEELGAMIQEIYQQIGKEGIIEVDNSGLATTFYEITEGVRLRNAGYFGAYSTTEEGKAMYTNPHILISKDKITSTDQLEPILTTLSANHISELVIYCDDIDMGVASMLAYTHMAGKFKTLIIKSPTLFKDWLYADFAAVTGATPIDSKEGKTFKNITLEDLGTCDKIVSTKDETRVLGIKDISAHLAKLTEENTEESKIRIAWLNTKAAILKVGANSESELSYISKKAKDGCAASYLALKDGVVNGAGYSLFYVANTALLKKDTIGSKILSLALQTPFYQICDNMGVAHTTIFPNTVIDPAIVVKNAVISAISVASTILTSKAIITLPRQ